MPAVGIPTGGSSKEYPGKLTPFVTVTCIVAAMGGLIFGYDIGISCGVTSMDPFLLKFFPSVYHKKNIEVLTSSQVSTSSLYLAALLSSLASSLYLAALLSSLAASSVTRRFGRKLSMFCGGLLFLNGALVNGFAVYPYGLKYNPNVSCAFHAGYIGHSTEDCGLFKSRVQKLIDQKVLSFSEAGSNVIAYLLPDHCGQIVNAINDEGCSDSVASSEEYLG